MRVLVVDDNVDAAESLVVTLECEGFDVAYSQDGADALAQAAAHWPQAVLLDLALPLIDGLEVARRLRRQPRGSELLLVAISGYGGEDDRRRSREAGFDLHLTKPVAPDAIVQMLRASKLPSRAAN